MFDEAKTATGYWPALRRGLPRAGHRVRARAKTRRPCSGGRVHAGAVRGYVARSRASFQPGLGRDHSRQSRHRSWLPGAGRTLTLPGRRILPPGPHEGIVVNLPEHRLYYFPKRKKDQPPIVVTYPVSIGKMDWRTPLGETQIIAKTKNPSWRPPESVRKEHAERGEPLPEVVPPGPDNPLGEYADAAHHHPGQLSDPRHQQSPGGRHGGDARLHPHVSRRHRRAVSAGAGRHEGVAHQRAGESRLRRWRTAARSASDGGRAGPDDGAECRAAVPASGQGAGQPRLRRFTGTMRSRR